MLIKFKAEYNTQLEMEKNDGVEPKQNR